MNIVASLKFFIHSYEIKHIFGCLCTVFFYEWTLCKITQWLIQIYYGFKSCFPHQMIRGCTTEAGVLVRKLRQLTPLAQLS
jgi:hypothetical protein